MSRMSLDTAIRLSAEVKGGGAIDRVKRSLQDFGKTGLTSKRDLDQLRAATFQFSRANDQTIAGLRNSISAFRGLQEQARIGSREFKRYGDEIKQLEGKLKGLDGAASAAGTSLGQKLAAGLAAAGVGRALQGITAQAGRFDAEVRKAAAIEGGAGSFGILRKEIEAVAAAAAGTPTEVAALATSLSRAGFSAKETTQALAGIVRGAEATSITFEDMGSIAADNLRAFGLQTVETGRVVDVLTQTANKSNQTVLDLGESMKYAAPIARNLGVPLEDLAATMALLANNGIRGSDAGTALRTGLTRLQIAASGSNEELEGLSRGNQLLASAMRSLGSEIIDTRGNLLPMDQVILSLRKNIQALSAGRRAEIAKALFGDEAGSKFLALLNSSEEQIKSMFGAVRDSGGVAEATQKKMQGFDYAVKVLGGNVEYLTNQIGGMIGAALMPLISGLNGAIGAAQKLPDPVKQVGAAAAAAGISVGALVLAINALKTSLGVVTSIRAAAVALTGYSGAATAAGAASATAATRAGMLLSTLTKLGKIGLIVIGVKFAIEGLDELITGLVGVRDAEGSARAMAERRGLTYVPSAAVQRRNAAASDYVSPFAGARDRAFALAQQIQPGQPRPGAGGPVALPVVPAGGAAAGGGGGGGRAAVAVAESMGAQIAKALQQSLNLTPAQSAGIVGNLMRESGLNPRINEGGAVGLPRGVGGYGLAQWTGSRQTDLVRFAGGAGAAGNLQTQLRFIVHELLGPESRALASLRRTTTPEEAAVVFDRDYERSGIKALPERKANARRVFSEIAGTGPGAGLDDFASTLQAEAKAAEDLQQKQAEANKRLEEFVEARTKSITELEKEIELSGATTEIDRQRLEYAFERNEIIDKAKQQETDLLAIQEELKQLGINQNIDKEKARIETEKNRALLVLQKREEQEINDLIAERVRMMQALTLDVMSPSAYNPLEQQKADLDALLQKYPMVGAAADQAAELASRGFADMVTGARSAKEVFADFLKGMADALIQTAKTMIAQYIAIGIAKMFAFPSAPGMAFNPSAAGPFGAGGLSTGLSFTPGFTGFANGGVMSSRGPMPLRTYSRGGVANSPQVAVFGEGMMNEAYVPLPDGRRIPVAMQMRDDVGRDRMRELMGASPAGNGSPVLNMSFETGYDPINKVEYVTVEQLQASARETRKLAASDGAKRGMSMTLDRLQQSPSTRSRVGIR
jgi:TP901 family phage tail tape measure protein